MKITTEIKAILIASFCLIGNLAETQVIKFLPNINVPFAGYMTINNESNKDIEIYKIRSDDFEKIEIHQTKIINNQTSMQKISRLVVKAKSKIELKPGGIHLMLFKPTKVLAHDDITEIHFLDVSEKVLFSESFTLKNRARNY